MTRTFAIAMTLIAGTALVLASVLPSEAGWRRDRNANIQDGYVTAHSRHGNGSVSGPVREARHGLQVRLPGGSWVYCRTSCSETLRVSTIDQWENQGSMIGAGTAQGECGFFGCLDLSWPF